ncbi:hypothetical protein CRENBAI_008311 [Crenichthys baileyi]|uniref:Uncharacterized protein n=1 Tax=Crenichthys baileyi TaxID=28760 RepID=A0AAV9SQS8_9TELE
MFIPGDGWMEVWRELSCSFAQLGMRFYSAGRGGGKSKRFSEANINKQPRPNLLVYDWHDWMKAGSEMGTSGFVQRDSKYRCQDRSSLRGIIHGGFKFVNT